MEASEKEIEVRSLTGESTTVFISSTKTIQDLKLLLIFTFPPASSSPDFHLFLKGQKLSTQSQICSYSIGSGDFMALVPFMKKEHLQTQKSNQPETQTSSKVSDPDPFSKFADSAWSDMMQDFSSLRDVSSNNSTLKSDSEGVDLGDSVQPASETYFAQQMKMKRKRGLEEKQEGCPDSLLWSILQSASKNVPYEQNCEGFVKVLESVNCLSYPYSQNCRLKNEASFLEHDAKNNCCSCLCPSWLKQKLKAFSLLNGFSAFLQLQQKKMSVTFLKEALDQLEKFAVQVHMDDIYHLSALCPKVVAFAKNDTEEGKLGDSVVIIDSPIGQVDRDEDFPKRARRRVSVDRIFNAVKRRDSSFKNNLWKVLQLSMLKNGNDAKFFSLENLLIYVKEAATVASEVKQVKRGSSAALRCHDTNPLTPPEMLEHLKKGIGSRGQMVHIEEIKARKAFHVEIPDELSDDTTSALNIMGISKLYSHQVESIQSSLSGKNVVVATMTSSGKSLCYNVPVLEELSHNILSCALYLFPTKALAQDQLRALLSFTKGFGAKFNIGVYDGDTSQEERKWLRDNARLLITNPDMLHMSILPFHGQFRRVLSNLRFVVIDEAHAYKGAFGCHTALVLRRLRRLCSHVYGSNPAFVFCSATSANPRDHCMELANLPTLELVKNDGSPAAEKSFILWNPASCHTSMHSSEGTDGKTVIRSSSSIMEISCIFAEVIQHGLRCIAFCKSRKLCELVLSYTQEILQETAPDMVQSVSAYRAGYLAEDRRRIESDFFGGKICGVAATNALELGIDVGHIDVTLHLGFPGSVASLWQQAGRAGRRDRPSLAVYVAFEGPMDQYFMKFPEKLFRSPIECFHIDAQNQQVLEQHLACAAAEHPLSLVHDEIYFGSGLTSALMNLKNRGYLSFDPSRDSFARIWSYIGQEKMPSRVVSIRAIETEKYRVIDEQKSEVLEEIEESRAFFQVYLGAVYMNQGKTYLVTNLDISNKVALCKETVLNYYTQSRDYTDIHVISGDVTYPARVPKIQFPRTTAQANHCKVTTTWIGFRRLRRKSNAVIDVVDDNSLPKYSYESQAVWIRVPQSVKASMDIEIFRAGLHAASHAVLNVVPLYVICNSSDLAPECANPHDTRYFPERILLYDQHPGGTGVSMQVQPHFTDLLIAALDLLKSCLCLGETGCPYCVQNLACHEYNEVLHKDAAITIIKSVLDEEKAHFGGIPQS